MSSLIERMAHLKTIQIKSDEEFVIEITREGLIVSRLCVSLASIEYNMMSGDSDVVINVINPKSKETEVVHYNYKT